MWNFNSCIIVLFGNVSGLATRKCLEDNEWDDPDVTQCRRVEQIRLENRANQLFEIVQGRKSDERDQTQLFRTEVLENIADELDDIVIIEQPILPNDISSTTNTLDIIIS